VERSIDLGVPRGLPFLAGPFQPEELLTKVPELLGSAAEGRQI
jgi:hypothetical protein